MITESKQRKKKAKKAKKNKRRRKRDNDRKMKDISFVLENFEKEVSKYVRTGDVERAHSALYNRNALKGFLETEIKHSGK